MKLRLFKITFFLFIVVCATKLFAVEKPHIDSIKILNSKISELTNDVTKQRNEIEYAKSLVQVGNGTISNQLSSSQHTLNTLGLLFTFLGVLIAIILPFATWYIRNLASQVNTNLDKAKFILENINSTKEEVIKVQTNVDSTQELIKNNLFGLYQSLQDEEIKAIFKRIEAEPNDTLHYFPKLTTVKINGDYFNLLKEVYKNTITINGKAAGAALMLLIQHYPEKSFNDDEVLAMLRVNFVTTGLYLSETSVYQKSVCESLKNKKIEDYLFLFENSILGIAVKDSISISEFVETTFNVWNELLDKQQKQLVVNLINDPNKFSQFKSRIPKWNTLLEIIDLH